MTDKEAKTHIIDTLNGDMNKEYFINELLPEILKDLERLEKMEKENQELAKTLELYNEKFAGHERVKTDLIQENQKLKKAIEIIKSKEVDITYFLYSNSYVFYNFYAIENELEPLSSQEYDLLNEMIHHDEI